MTMPRRYCFVRFSWKILLRKRDSFSLKFLFQGRIYELYGREAFGKKTLSPSRHQGSSNQKFSDLLLKNAGPSHISSFALSIVMDRSSYYLLVLAVAALLLQCELASFDRWHLPRCTIMYNNTRTYKNSFLILPISFINFLHQVQSSPKSWQRFEHMDEVTCGGNAM
ncbi:uncharacterized protein LOC126693641 isoform X3 [Quercus robur]|uniref:uncharacterized protein LOC126693641 isoform X3 n=1 Tax=Quercus robur TaxID=38942 RepID=UPI0021637A1E|nr:uncharacterized protein LOC126693641 isoform X3 [Quercus robur]